MLKSEIINGNWGEWSSWSPKCNKSCENITQIRTRKCNNPEPNDVGTHCNVDGSSNTSYQTIKCGTGLHCPGKCFKNIKF